MNQRAVKRRKTKYSQERQIRERHMQRMKQRRRRQLITRGSVIAFLVAVAVLIIMFMTPFFNVRNLDISGNNRVDTNTIMDHLPNVVGESIFKVRDKDISSSLSGIIYIDQIHIEKNYFPASIAVEITEKQPSMAVLQGGIYTILDDESVILEQREDNEENIALLTYYHETFEDFKNDITAVDELRKFFDIMDRIGLRETVTKIDLLEYNEINFQYEGRINVICGSGVDMEQKLRLFKASINNPGITDNTHGEIDLSTAGKAMLRP